jgi:quinoprotein relay system zinc metallohydrolase 2
MDVFEAGNRGGSVGLFQMVGKSLTAGPFMRNAPTTPPAQTARPAPLAKHHALGEPRSPRPRWHAWLFVPVVFVAGLGAADALAFDVTEVAPGVFVHQGEVALASAFNRGDIANIGFIIGDEAVAVIDTGGSAAVGADLLEAIGQQTDKPVRYVINTHVHPDHVFGNAAFESLGATFVGSAALPDAMAARAEHYLASNRDLLGPDLAEGSELISPSLVVNGSLTLDLGGRELELRGWKTAHTDSDLTVFDPSSRTLFAGDLVFLEHVPAIDGSLTGWLEALDDLGAIPAERVVPGHGPASAPWPQALDPQRRYLKAVASGVRDLIAEGARIEDAPALVAPEEGGQWKLFDAFHPRNVTAAFAELEWE